MNFRMKNNKKKYRAFETVIGMENQHKTILIDVIYILISCDEE